MKYSIEPMTIEPEFQWGLDHEGGWSLFSRLANEEWKYWGMVSYLRHNSYEILSKGRAFAGGTLESAKRRAEEYCAGDMLRNLAKIKSNSPAT